MVNISTIVLSSVIPSCTFDKNLFLVVRWIVLSFVLETCTAGSCYFTWTVDNFLSEINTNNKKSNFSMWLKEPNLFWKISITRWPWLKYTVVWLDVNLQTSWSNQRHSFFLMICSIIEYHSLSCQLPIVKGTIYWSNSRSAAHPSKM